MNNIESLIKNDINDSNILRIRNVLKDFGIKTEIPHIVAKDAISYSKLDPITFLQKIKEYLSNKVYNISKRSGMIKLNFIISIKFIL